MSNWGTSPGWLAGAPAPELAGVEKIAATGLLALAEVPKHVSGERGDLDLDANVFISSSPWYKSGVHRSHCG